MIMASFAASPRSPQLLGLLLLATFTAVVDSARDVSPAAIKVFPSCSKTLMPKRCSATLSVMSKKLVETKQEITGPELAGYSRKEFTSEPCVSECIKVIDAATSKAAAATTEAGGQDAISQLKDYLDPLFIHNEGPVGPCQCSCPDVHCSSAEEAVAVRMMGDASSAMLDMVNLLVDMSDDEDQLEDDEKKAKVEPLERSMESGVLHVSCGLTREPQKCADELSALAGTVNKARVVAAESGLMRDAASKLSSPVTDCDTAMRGLEAKLELAGATVTNLADIRDAIRSYVQGDGKQPPRCKLSCPPPPEKPCSAKETDVVDSLKGVHDAWVAADKFLAELLPPN